MSEKSNRLMSGRLPDDILEKFEREKEILDLPAAPLIERILRAYFKSDEENLDQRKQEADTKVEEAKLIFKKALLFQAEVERRLAKREADLIFKHNWDERIEQFQKEIDDWKNVQGEDFETNVHILCEAMAQFGLETKEGFKKVFSAVNRGKVLDESLQVDSYKKEFK